jgi:hypothetical protein
MEGLRRPTQLRMQVRGEQEQESHFHDSGWREMRRKSEELDTRKGLPRRDGILRKGSCCNCRNPQTQVITEEVA